MTKRITYDASEEAEQALADHGTYGFRSRNAMINAAVLQIARKGKAKAQDRIDLYNDLIDDLDAVASTGDELADELSSVLSRMLQYRSQTSGRTKPTLVVPPVKAQPTLQAANHPMDHGDQF